jgi:radical SAM superfamily enzyme YgiQ (UPF0313 family)
MHIDGVVIYFIPEFGMRDNNDAKMIIMFADEVLQMSR